MKKCVNIDWLEVYCLEDSITYPHDAEFFRRAGWQVREREYGTPMYREMFTLVNHYGEDELEIRRVPKSDNTRIHGLFDINSCHVRLCNRTCYYNNAALYLQQFLEKSGLHYQRISRIDICLDFVRFDFGDFPDRFMRRYMEGKYSKINQANISAHGSDSWDGRTWNSVSWGAPKSMIKTRFYNKSLELNQVHNKPYIRQAWRECGLVDDEITLEKIINGKPEVQQVWRVEFQIKSGTKNWFVINNQLKRGQPIESKRNDLTVYSTRAEIYSVFLSLCEHYFHFKKYVDGQRKDRCPDKQLFQVADIRNFYKLDNNRVRGTASTTVVVDRLLSHLIGFRDTHYQPELYNACNIIIQQLEFERRTAAINAPWPADEIELLRRLIKCRIEGSQNTLSVDISEVKNMMEVEKQLFNEMAENICDGKLA